MARRKRVTSSSSSSDNSSSDSSSEKPQTKHRNPRKRSTPEKDVVTKKDSNTTITRSRKKESTSKTNLNEEIREKVRRSKENDAKPVKHKSRSGSREKTTSQKKSENRNRNRSDNKKEERVRKGEPSGPDRQPDLSEKRPKSQRDQDRKPKSEIAKKPSLKISKNTFLKKALFPIMQAKSCDDVSVNIESDIRTVTETTLISYPSVNASVLIPDKTRTYRRHRDSTRSGEGRYDRGRFSVSPERFKSLSSVITVKNIDYEPKRTIKDRPPKKEVSLREQVGWDPFQASPYSTYGDHDDRQFSSGYNDSYTRKEFDRGRSFSRGSFQRGGRGARAGGVWTNNRNFARNTSTWSTREGINDQKWRHDMYEQDN